MNTYFEQPRCRIISFGIFIYLFLYYMIAGLFPSFANLLEILSTLGEIFALYLIAISLSKFTREKRTPWIWFLAALSIYFMGEAIWTVFAIESDVNFVFLPISDLFYLLSVPIFLGGIFAYVKERSPQHRYSILYDVLIALVAGTTVIAQTMLIPLLKTDVRDELFLQLIYPIVDLGYLAGILSLFLLAARERLPRWSDLLICMGLITNYLGDHLYYNYALHYYIQPELIDPLWPLTFTMIALACHRSAVGYDLELRLPHIVFILLRYVAILAPYAIAISTMFLLEIEVVKDHPIIIGSLVTFVLIIARQIYILFSNEQLITQVKESNAIIRKKQKQLAEQNQILTELHAQKSHEANTDFLTGLYNRRYLDDLMKNPQIFNGKVSIGLILIDVDLFKGINDTYGHQTGDEVLQIVAECLSSSTRNIDIPVRQGGDEFAILLPCATHDSVVLVADRLHHKIRQSEFIPPSLHVTLSIGGAFWEGDIADYRPDELFKLADHMLYQVKENGRGHYRIS